MIDFRNVSFRFNSSSDSPWIIKNLDLSIGDEEFHLLLGPSGCGKTTVLNLLAGFESVDIGSIKVKDQLIERPGVDRIVIFQGDDSLYPWLTALQNVEFGLKIAGVPRKERREQAVAFLELVGLTGHEHKYPNELSGGMKQRIQIARALVCRSPILLMDEPFGALDAQTRATLQQELADIWNKSRRTILFITHDITEAILLADRISIMTSGPGSRIKETITVSMSRPRSPSDSEFSGYYRKVQILLGTEEAAAVDSVM